MLRLIRNIFIDKPIKPKKQKNDAAKKLKNIVSKNVNKIMEEEMRNRANPGQGPLSKAQQAVVKSNTKM